MTNVEFKANPELFTIGYQGKTIEEFISGLKQHNITRLIDVRAVPWSRKKDFSQSVLKERLAQNNIAYVHKQALGNPAAIRKKLKEDNDRDYFIKAFTAYLETNRHAIAEAYSYIVNETSCLMCFEQDPNQCHRSLVADKIKEYSSAGLKVIHI